MSDAKLLPEEIIRQVADACDLVEIVGACVPLKKTGATLTGLCPFHREKTPSFTVYPARQSFKCYGCGAGGDGFSFVMLHEGVGFRDAALMLAARAGIAVEGAATSTGIPIDPKPRPKPVPSPEPARPLRLPGNLRRGTRADLRAVADRRGLSMAGVELADARGLILFGEACRVPCWLVADSARVSAEARRIDGSVFPAFKDHGERKAHTLKGSSKRWPIGAREAAGFPFVALTEGGPDLLAACHFIAAEGRESDVAAVTVLGGANSISEDALLYLANRRVRIFPHADPAGQAAAVRWTAQLERVGCEVDAFRFDGLRRCDGGVMADLNDLAMVDADCFEAERAELSEVLPR